MSSEKKNNDYLLEVEHLKQYFPVHQGFSTIPLKAVDDISFAIRPGETLGLVGESGCGKTTVGRTLLRLYQPTAGKITFDGNVLFDSGEQYDENGKMIVDANGKPVMGKKVDVNMMPYRKEMQMVFQDPYSSLNPRMTVEDIIGEPLDVHKLYRNKKERREKILDLMELVGLNAEHAMRYAHEFSGGQRQRIGLARAMVMEPELVVADEPISALDVSIRAQVLNLLKKFQREKQVTYLFIAHDLSIVRFISDRIGVIYKGNIVEVADAEELFNFPLHPYTHSLISAIPIPDPQLEKNKVLYTYDPSIHDYSVDKPEFVDIGHNHFVYGNKKEIEEYKALREKGEPLQPITIRKPGEKVKEENHEVHLSKAEDEFLKTPVHDTGSVWYKVLSFFFPIIGIIAAMVYKKKQYYHNYKACKQGALYGFAVLAVILLIFIIALILVVL